ncbi:MAG: FeoB-associated Cys-rich membrane protein [Bacteroidia bacterium]
MIQSAIIYIILVGACAYVGYRMYGQLKKNQACDKCALMEAAKKNNL